MKIETVLIPVKLLIIKACFRFLTFESLQDKYPCRGVRGTRCELRVLRFRILDFGLQIDSLILGNLGILDNLGISYFWHSHG
jgi:hypothetical protein